MIKRLEDAVAEAARLPTDRQEAIAALILDEIRDEQGWEERFAGSGDVLDALARRAKARHAAGETTPLSFPDP